MEAYDLVVVGGGFAGLSCAQTASERGLKTLVLEKKAASGVLPHTTGIVVKEVADIWNIPKQFTRKLDGIRLYAPSFEYVDLTSPDHYFLATDTSALQSWMAEKTEAAGASIRYQVLFHYANAADGEIHIEQHKISTRYMVGCDGAESRVARNFNLDSNDSFLFGIEAVYKGVKNINDDHLHVFLDSALAPGYMAWLIPGDGVTQIGLAVRTPRVPKLDNFISKISALFNFDNAELIESRTGLIPNSGCLSSFAKENVMLLGDAAGMASPLSAGGIHPSVELSRIAGIAISDYLLENGPSPETVLKKVMPNYRYKKGMRNVVDLLNVENKNYDRFINNYLFKSLAKTMFFHHRDLFSWNTWKDVVTDVKAVGF